MFRAGTLRSAAPMSTRMLSTIRRKATAAFAVSEREQFAAERIEKRQKRTVTDRERRMIRRSTSLPGFSPSEIITKKREGVELTREEIEWFISSFHHGDVEDYQMSALLMSIAIKGMSNREASDLTLSMVRTGDTAELSRIRPGFPKVDKHSTGGVGDTTSLILAPLLASLDVVVPLLSGRGLGHTGGTLDKLDAIPNLDTSLEKEEFLRVLHETGSAFASPQTTGFAPVDSRIYALRDVSGSVDSIALVASSVMSKKLAANPDALLLDVKRGRGAFFTGLNEAAALAAMMCSIGSAAGIETIALITNMDTVLGGSVGNWVEVQEAVQVLAGSKYEVGADPLLTTSEHALHDLRDLALSEAAVMLGLAGKASSFREGFEMARDQLEKGRGLDKFAEIIQAQGGDARVIFNLSESTPKLLRKTLFAEERIVVRDIDARKMGCAATSLGAGRRYAGDEIDWHAGIVIHAKVGEVIEEGSPILTAVVRDNTDQPIEHELLTGLPDCQHRLEHGYRLACDGVTAAPAGGRNFVTPPPLIEYLVDSRGMAPFKSLH